MDYTFDVIYTFWSVVGGHKTNSSITRPHSSQMFVPGIYGIIIYGEQLQRIGKILK